MRSHKSLRPFRCVCKYVADCIRSSSVMLMIGGDMEVEASNASLARAKRVV